MVFGVEILGKKGLFKLFLGEIKLKEILLCIYFVIGNNLKLLFLYFVFLLVFLCFCEVKVFFF